MIGKVKVKVTVSVCRKTLLSLWRFYSTSCKCLKNINMIRSWTNMHFRLISLRSRSEILFLQMLCHRSSAFVYRQILIELYTNVKCDNIFDKLAIQNFRVMVKIIFAIFRKYSAISITPFYEFWYDFAKILSMTITGASSHFSFVDPRSRSWLPFLENTLSSL